MRTTIQLRLLILCGIILLAFSVKAQTNTEVNIGRVSPGEIDYKGFKLSQNATININGAGASYEKWGNNLIFYGWIIESKSREVVWSLLDEYENKFFHDEGPFSFNADIKLKKGTYEVYYTAMYGNSYYKYNGNNFSDIVREVVKVIIDDDDHPYFQKEKNYMTVSSNNKGFSVNNGREYVDNILNKSIVSFVRIGDDEVKQKDFTLKEPTKVYIYCQGERQGNEFFDFA